MIEKTYSAKKQILFLILIIAISEITIMFLLPSIGFASLSWQGNLLDTLLLIIMIAPLLQFTVVSPMKKYIHALESAEKKVENREHQMLSTLNALAAASDNDTGAHIVRTQHYVKILATRLKSMGHFTAELSDRNIKLLESVAPLHDIGKVGIPHNILKKAGPLTDEEKTIMYSHATIGENILSKALSESNDDDDLFSIAIKVSGSHHERWDGLGYPRGLMANNIPIEGRIMAVADVFDALVSERPYKKGWEFEKAFDKIVSDAGSVFDPIVVEAFITEKSQFKDIAYKKY